MKTVNDFDRIANYYDVLSRMVFGNQLDQASFRFLPKIIEGSNVLIVGGGRGRILTKIPKGVEIDYLELSEQMIRISKTKSYRSVNFIHDDFLKFETKRNYDYIVFPYFLDVFAENHLSMAILKASSLLKPSGSLLITDFQFSDKWHQKLLLQTMHLFFRYTVRLESSELQQIRGHLSNQGYKEVKISESYGGMIFTGIFKLSETF